jgi:hypothetical protein
MKRSVKDVLVAIGLALSVGLSGVACTYVNQETQTCLVGGKDRTSNSDGVSEMRVYTDCGTFVVEDNFISGFKSADLYGSIQPGKTYKIKSGGVRVGPLSMFPTILEAEEI